MLIRNWSLKSWFIYILLCLFKAYQFLYKSCFLRVKEAEYGVILFLLEGPFCNYCYFILVWNCRLFSCVWHRCFMLARGDHLSLRLIENGSVIYCPHWEVCKWCNFSPVNLQCSNEAPILSAMWFLSGLHCWCIVFLFINIFAFSGIDCVWSCKALCFVRYVRMWKAFHL